MSSDWKGKARSYSPILPESGESASEQLSHPASGYAQATQVTECSRNMGIPKTAYGQAQARSLSQAAASGQLKYNEIADQIFKAPDDSLIFSLVAEGWNFDQIKNEKFRNRKEVTPGLLESRAQTIGAFWTKPEDDRLSAMEELEESKEYGDLVRLRDEHFRNPAREGGDIQRRYNYLKSWREGQGAGGQAQAEKPPNGQRHSTLEENPGSPAYGSYGQQSYPRTLGQSSVQTAASTQGLSGTSISSTPNSSHGSAAHQPMTHQQAANPQPGGRSGAGRDANEEAREALETRVDEVKVKLAQDCSWEEVLLEFCPERLGYKLLAMKSFLRRRGCQHWNTAQTDEVLRLRTLGHDWARISEMLPAPKRTPKEAEARFLWRTG